MTTVLKLNLTVWFRGRYDQYILTRDRDWGKFSKHALVPTVLFFVLFFALNMFIPLNAILEYFIKPVIIHLFLLVFTLYTGVLQALQRIVLPKFVAVD